MTLIAQERPAQIYRRRDGSIDFDFYRAQAAVLRSQTLRDMFALRATLKFVLITAAAIIAVAVISAVPGHV